MTRPFCFTFQIIAWKYLCRHEYTRTCLRSLSLIFSDGTEQEVALDFGMGCGRTKLSESGQYDCMDIESYAAFHRPVSLQNLTAIRINGAEVSLK